MTDGQCAGQSPLPNALRHPAAGEEFYRTIFNATGEALFIHDQAGRLLDVNERMCAMFGCSRDQALGLDLDQLSLGEPPYSRAEAGERVRRAIAEGPQVFEWRSRRLDGSLFWSEVSLRACRLAGDLRVIASVRDISERKRLEADRDRLFNLSLDLFAVGSFDGRLTQLNPAWTRALGWSVDELTREPWLAFVHPDDHPATIAAASRLVAGEPVLGFENRYRCRDGSWRLLSWNTFPLVDERLIFAVVRDLTEQRATEERLRHADKMNAIGQLAGGVAHDFNNQLGAIMGYADLLLRRIDDPDQRRCVERIATAVHRSADLTGKLLAFARKGQYQSVPVDLHAVIAETVDILARSIDRRIAIEQVLKARSAVVVGDPSQLQNALLNLGLNARDAMPDGGTLRFATEVIHLEREDLPRHGLEVAGPHLRVEVSDTGCGMSGAVKAHLFEPFFTTKAPGKGTGMGLAAVYGTVRGHRGTVNVYSETGHGTAVRLLLPLAGAGEAASAADADGGARLRPLRILVVDDEEHLREVLGDLLADDGHTVTTASDGRTGAQLYAERWREIDLVILDMIMPGMGGRDCFRAMKAVNPGVRALLSTGFSIDSEARTILAEGVLGFIQKPFTHRDLVRSLAQAMEGAGG